jgi:hypothetical protein
MALLDVSDVLDDPDFNSPFSLIRSTAAVDDTGTNVVTTAAPVTVIGVIQPTAGTDLNRLPDAARQYGAIVIYTRFPLNLDAPGVEADKLIWAGCTYTVMTCSPWLYGAGYYQSIGVLTTLS